LLHANTVIKPIMSLMTESVKKTWRKQ